MELDYQFLIKTFFLILKGIPTTLKITAISLVLASPLAFGMALAKIYDIKYLKKIVVVYVSFMRGTPIVLQILVVYSLLPSLLNVIVKQLGLKIDVFAFNPIMYAYIIFTLSSAAILSEVFRAALLGVKHGQLEAGLSIGMSHVQTYIRIIIPQALVIALPSLCNATVNLIKNTSLAFIMSVQDITAIGKIQASYGYNYIESYADVFVVYIVVCTLIQLLFNIAEKYCGTFRQRLKT